MSNVNPDFDTLKILIRSASAFADSKKWFAGASAQNFMGRVALGQSPSIAGTIFIAHQTNPFKITEDTLRLLGVDYNHQELVSLWSDLRTGVDVNGNRIPVGIQTPNGVGRLTDWQVSALVITKYTGVDTANLPKLLAQWYQENKDNITVQQERELRALGIDVEKLKAANPDNIPNALTNLTPETNTILGRTVESGPVSRCFAAGTPVLMADGTEKPIQEVEAGDMVMSFDPTANNGLGAMVPRMVTRTFVNTTRVFIDLYGLKVTPGHEFLSDNGEWMLVAEILRRDRAIIRNDENGLGMPFRARTNQPLKSFGDAVFKTRFIDPRTGTERRAEVRGGIPFEKVYSVMSGIQTRRSASLLEVLHFEGRISVHAYAENGRLCDNQDNPVGVLDWPAGTTPFDHEGAENHIVTLDGLPFTPDWILRIPRDGEETRAVMNAGGGADDCLLISPDGVKTMRFEDGKGVFNDPAPRQTLPPQRPVLAASNPTLQPSMNRAQRRKRAALTGC